MKYNFFLTICLLLFKSQSIFSQSTYDLQFVNPISNCSGDSSTFCITIQIKAAENNPSFEIGSYTIFFNFNKEVIINPIYTSINFNQTNFCAENGTIAPYDVPAFSFSTFSGFGEANISCLMTSPNKGCPTITSNGWVDVGTVCFHQLQENINTDLIFNSAFTLINLNTNFPQHQPGIFNNFNTPTNCPPIDTDADGIDNQTEINFGLNPNNSDSDNDGISDFFETNNATQFNNDTDLDNIINALDNDDDNDGTPTALEDTNNNQNWNDDDTDNDGIPNYLDNEATAILLNNLANNNFKVLNNTSTIQISNLNKNINKILITDLLGKSTPVLIYNKTATINKQNFTKGLYIITLINNKDKVINKQKIVIW